MRKTMASLVLLAAASLTVGCGHHPKPTTTAATPLSVAEWRELPVNQKYEEVTFDRLRMEDPELEDERTWQRFMIETVIPERRKDLPDDFPS